MISTYEKANRTKVLAIVAVFAMVLCAFAAFAPTETDAATDEQSYSGTLGTAQNFPAGTNVVIDKKTTITTNGVLTIEGDFRVAEGVTLTIQNGGQLIVKNGLFKVEGTIIVTGSGINTTASGTDEATPSMIVVQDNEQTGELFKDYGVVIDGTVTVTKGASFEHNGDDAGSILINNGGTLDVVKSGNTSASISNLDVKIAVGGTFNFEGVIGESMTVTAYGTVSGTTMKTQSSITLTHYGDNDRSLSDLTFTTTSKNVTGYYMAGNDVDTQLFREFALNVTGTVANNDSIVFNGSVVDGKYYVSEDAAKTSSDMYDAKVTAKVYISTLTISETGNATNNTYIQIADALNIRADKAKGTNGTLVNNGTIELVGAMTAQEDSAISGKGIIAINGGSATLRGMSEPPIDNIYGAYYADRTGTVDVLFITDIAAAISGAVAIEEEDVYIGSAGITSETGAYVVSANISVPADITLTIDGQAIAVAKGVTMTFDVDAAAYINNGMVYVNGTIVDNSLDLSGYEGQMEFEVKIVSEDEETNTYTTLANALDIIQSGTIYLYDNVTISGAMVIGSDITVMYAEGKTGTIGFEDKNASLTINGLVVLEEGQAINTAVDGENATVTVNNMLKYVSENNIGVSIIYGVYFEGALGEDAENTKYITSVSVASTNSAEISGEMEIYGNISMGDVTFTQGEDKQIVIKTKTDDKQTITGNVTLAGGAEMNIIGTFTGSVTDGTNTVSFSKVTGAYIEFHSEETAEGTTTDMCMSGALIAGDVAVSAGTVVIGENTQIGDGTKTKDGSLTISSGATLEVAAPLTVWTAYYDPLLVAKQFPVYTDSAVESTFASLFVEGTLNIVQGGSMDAAVSVINGTVSVAQKAGVVHFDGAVINGTIAAEKSIAFDIALVNGTIDGKTAVQALIAMPGCTVVADDVNEGTADVTNVYINGEEYATVYAVDGTPIGAILIFAEIPGVQIETSVFYSDAAMTQKINGVYVGNSFPVIGDDFSVATLANMFNAAIDVGLYENVYISMAPAEVEGTVSVGTGLDLYIDNVRVAGGQDFPLTVGTHTVSFDVKAGYDGSGAAITFNGQTVQSGGSITVTADMTEFTLIASGAVPSQGQVVIDEGSDDGMGITDYLLIILVVLVIVLAVIVAMRMMRS